MLKVLYFSPTGGTRDLVSKLADYIKDGIGNQYMLSDSLCKNEADASGKVRMAYIDVTSPMMREMDYQFSKDDTVLIAAPTYAGRIPNKVMPFFRDHIKGQGARCIIMMSYGNRSYDNSLIEMVRLMEANEFAVIGAAAFVTRHSMSQTLAAGRPDQEDLQELQAYAKQMCDKLLRLKDGKDAQDLVIHMEGEVGPYYVPKKEDGEKAVFLKSRPVLDRELCSQCGRCEEVCPMGSISAENAYETTAICIKCHACIRACPMGARHFEHPDLLSHIRMIEKNYGPTRADNHWIAE